jgi:methionyl-tRNA formyltransferase
MRIILITQNEPFYLSENLDTLLKRLPKEQIILGAIVASASPFGKKESFIKKAIKTKKIFGLGFFLYYTLRFIYSKLFKKSVNQTLSEHGVNKIEIQGSINSKENLNIIKSYNPDLLISILGNQIFKKSLIDLAPKGCINLHTALLPKYRGLMPTFWVLKNNEKYTGVSVFFVDEGIDSGPIIVQEKVKIGTKTQQQLIKETKQIGMNLILKSIDLIAKGELKLIENPESEKSYYSFPTPEDVKEFKRQGKKFF